MKTQKTFHIFLTLQINRLKVSSHQFFLNSNIYFNYYIFCATKHANANNQCAAYVTRTERETFLEHITQNSNTRNLKH
jgi:hypothetical protein